MVHITRIGVGAIKDTGTVGFHANLEIEGYDRANVTMKDILATDNSDIYMGFRTPSDYKSFIGSEAQNEVGRFCNYVRAVARQSAGALAACIKGRGDAIIIPFLKYISKEDISLPERLLEENEWLEETSLKHLMQSVTTLVIMDHLGVDYSTFDGTIRVGDQSLKVGINYNIDIEMPMEVGDPPKYFS